MGVEAGQLERADSLDRARHVVDGETELRVLLAGRDEGVRVRPDARRDAQHDLLTGRDSLEPLDLVERVEHDMADALGARVLELLLRLVVAVQVDPLGREPALQRQVQLAAGRDVAREPLLREQAVRGGGRKRLARVDDLEAVAARAEGLDEGARAKHDVVLGVHVRRRAELRGDLHHIAAADLEPPPLVDP